MFNQITKSITKDKERFRLEEDKKRLRPTIGSMPETEVFGYHGTIAGFPSDHHKIDLPAGNAAGTAMRKKFILMANGAKIGHIDAGFVNAACHKLSAIDFGQIQHPPADFLACRQKSFIIIEL